MAEKRLIDADELYKELEGVRMDYIDEDSMSSKFAADVIETVQDEYLRKSPTVDAVEVVRCRECRHWNSRTGFCNFNSHFSMDGFDWDVFNDDDFCSRGERRTDG